MVEEYRSQRTSYDLLMRIDLKLKVLELLCIIIQSRKLESESWCY